MAYKSCDRLSKILVALGFMVTLSAFTSEAVPVPSSEQSDTGDVSAKKPNLPTIESPLARVELDGYLRNKRAMQLQIKCVVYDGPCDIVGKEVKRYIVVGLSGKCSDCSPRLKTAVEKVAHHIQEHYPQAWYDAIYKYLVAPTLGDSYRTSSTTEENVTESPEEALEA